MASSSLVKSARRVAKREYAEATTAGSVRSTPASRRVSRGGREPPERSIWR